MTRIAKEVLFGSLDSVAYPSAYDKTKLGLGSLWQQYTGGTPLDKFIGPQKIGMARPMEQSTAIASAYPHVIRWSSTIDWVFLADISAAGVTRRTNMYEYDRSTSIFTWKGFITMTYPSATNHTIRGMRMLYETYTTGTAAVSGTAVTGSGTTWTTDRMNIGSRIGFGSTDPTQISTWYVISAVGSNTGITLSASAGTIADGPYVIEDLQCLTATTNATAANGGLFVAKGLRYEDFTTGGTNIPAATNTDLIKAVYWLADAATVLNTGACGCAMEDRDTWAQQYAYVLDTATARVYKYNVRVALAGLASGKSTSAFVLRTGNQAVTGTISQTNNGRVGNLSHGPGSGVDCLYFVTTTRVYRAALSGIVDATTTWQSDVMLEIPPGGTTTYAAGGAISSVEIAGDIDRLVITSTGAAGIRSYVTKYNTTSDQFDHIFLVDDKQLDQSSSDSGGVAHPSIQAVAFSVWSLDGVLYLIRGTTAVNNQIYTIPIGAHRFYALTNDQLGVTPAISIADASQLYRVYVNEVVELGEDTFSLPPEPYNVYYRTGGIDDDSGAWTLLTSRDLTGVGVSSEIQFAFSAKILGGYCIPPRIMSVAIVYESTDDLPSQHQWNFADSDVSNGNFGFTQIALFGSTPPTHTIEIRRSDTDALVLTQASTGTTNGEFEYWTGAAWAAGLDSDTVGKRRRFRPTGSLPGGVDLYAKIFTS